jgi:hypothetical protein
MSGSFLINSARNVVRLTGERIFTSTNFNPISWTVPAGVTSISIVVVGGGGGGGGVSINSWTIWNRFGRRWWWPSLGY